MKVEQFVMAYGVEQDRIRAMLPDGFVSLRPVLRINTEIRQSDDGGEQAYIELNTSVEAEGKRGWINIAHWESPGTEIRCDRDGSKVTLTTDFLKLTYTGTGIAGGCPAEKDNAGCFFTDAENQGFRPAETINEKKEFCDCEFAWTFSERDAHGVSIGKTLPAFEEEQKTRYEKQDFTPENAAAIPCRQVLGSYIVKFERTEKK